MPSLFDINTITFYFHIVQHNWSDKKLKSVKISLIVLLHLLQGEGGRILGRCFCDHLPCGSKGFTCIINCLNVSQIISTFQKPCITKCITKIQEQKYLLKQDGLSVHILTIYDIYYQYMLAFQNVLVYLLYEYTSICIIIIIFINIQYVQVCEMGQNNYYFLVFRLILRFNSQRAAAKIIETILFFLIELKGPGKNKIRKKYRLLSGKDGGFTYQTVR